MSLSVLHALNCTITDASDSDLDPNAVRPSDWNAEHVLVASAAGMLGATAAGAVALLTNFIPDSSGRLGLGLAPVASFAAGALNPNLQNHGTDAGTCSISSARYSADALGAHLYLGKSRGATVGTHTIVTSGDTLGTINFAGSSGTNFVTAAAIRGESDGTPGASSDMPGRLIFMTTPDGSGTITERMRISSAGLVGIATAAADALLSVNGVSSFGAGTAALPSLAGFGDLDTGFWFPAANTLAWSTAGVERARVDANGKLVIGLGAIGVSTFTAGTINPLVQTHFNDDTATNAVARYSADTTAARLILAKSRHATTGSHTIVQSGDALGAIQFEGSDGTNFITAARIRGESDGTPGASNDMPGRLTFWTTPDGSGTLTERMRIDNAGNLSFAALAAAATYNAGTETPRIQLAGTSASTAAMGQARHSADTGGSLLHLAKSRHATAGSHTIVTSGDTLGAINFAGSDGTNFINAAQVRGESDGTPGASNDMPGRLTFWTTPDGSGTLTERMRIDSIGQVGIGMTAVGSWLSIAAGTNAEASMLMTAGTILTTPVAGALEFDGVNFYQTIDTTSGRGGIPVEQYVHLAANGSNISTIANFFGTTSNISLVANAYYIIEIELWYTVTGGTPTVTWTLTNSAAPTSQNIYFEMTPVAGMVAPPGTATMLVGQVNNDATAAKTITTGTLAAATYYTRMKIWLKNGTGTSLKIQATASTNSITPLLNSYWRARRMSPNNIGTLAA